MKRTILLLIVSFVLIQSHSYSWEWEPYGPEGIKANKICFFDSGSVFSVICVDTGMYISGIPFSFEFYSYTHMAVVEAVSPSYYEDSIIVILRDGSWSDGIYSFNSTNGQFSVLDYCYNPGFIRYNEENDGLYVGYEYGLIFTEDGTTWTEVPYFNNKSCIDMEIAGEYLIVATTEENNNTFLSDDNGLSWSELVGDNITELSGDHWANSGIYGISEGDSYNGGLYQFDFSTLEWDNVFYYSQLNAVGMNSGGGLYVGWYSGIPPNVGIASCFPELTFLNDGLPNLNINAISAPYFFGGTILYCCTDSGVLCRILSVGIEENTLKQNIHIYPNPISNRANISIKLSGQFVGDISIFILNNQGQKVDDIGMEKTTSNEFNINWNKGNLPAGVYYLVIKTQKETRSEKLIIL